MGVFQMKKSKLLSIMLSVAMVLTMFNQVLSLKVNAESNDVLCHISKLLDEFNQEHDTSYKLADDKQLDAVGLNVKDVEDFYKNMSDEDFYSYICTAYERDMAKRSNDNSQDNTAVAENHLSFDGNFINPDEPMYSGTQKYYYRGSSTEFLTLTATWYYGDGDYRYSSVQSMGYGYTPGTFPYYVPYATSHTMQNDARDMYCVYYCSKYIGYGITDLTNWTITVTFHAGLGDVWGSLPM